MALSNMYITWQAVVRGPTRHVLLMHAGALNTRQMADRDMLAHLVFMLPALKLKMAGAGLALASFKTHPLSRGEAALGAIAVVSARRQSSLRA